MSFREIPMMMLLCASIASTAAAMALRQEHRVHPRPGRVVVLADHPRPVGPSDRASMVVTAALGLGVLGVTVHRRRRDLLAREGVERPTFDTPPGVYRTKAPTVRVLPAAARNTLRARATFATVGWSTFTALALTMMLFRPEPERWGFVAACLALLGPSRLMLRYRAGEAEWVGWLLVLAPLTLVLSRSLLGVAAPLVMGLLFHGFARVEEWLEARENAEGT